MLEVLEEKDDRSEAGCLVAPESAPVSLAMLVADGDVDANDAPCSP